MIDSLSAAGEDDVLAGRLLGYLAADDAFKVQDLIGSGQHTGLLLKGEGAPRTAWKIRQAGPLTRCVGVDVGAWSKSIASPQRPMQLAAPADGLFPIDLRVWADDVLRGAAADFVLTPSLFIQHADWTSLRHLLHATSPVRGRDDVFTLIATDAAMLDAPQLACFLDTLLVHGPEQRLAFVFAGASKPLARPRRLAALRTLLAALPGSLVLGIEGLAGFDVLTHAGSAAIGLTGSLRRPQRPTDGGGGPVAKDFVPGLFLRELWETRSPRVYADWYANSQTPTCAECGGRAVDRFTRHDLHKQQILRHNLHAWMEVVTEVVEQAPSVARAWLADERVRGLQAHLALNSVRTPVEADAMLRAYCELDDPQHRRVALNGSWR